MKTLGSSLAFHQIAGGAWEVILGTRSRCAIGEARSRSSAGVWRHDFAIETHHIVIACRKFESRLTDLIVAGVVWEEAQREVFA
ncbi:MAG: hypothetical protein ACK4VP_09470 [Nitrospira sp.]